MSGRVFKASGFRASQPGRLAAAGGRNGPAGSVPDRLRCRGHGAVTRLGLLVVAAAAGRSKITVGNVNQSQLHGPPAQVQSLGLSLDPDDDSERQLEGKMRRKGQSVSSWSA